MLTTLRPRPVSLFGLAQIGGELLDRVDLRQVIARQHLEDGARSTSGNVQVREIGAFSGARAFTQISIVPYRAATSRKTRRTSSGSDASHGRHDVASQASQGGGELLARVPRLTTARLMAAPRKRGHSPCNDAAQTRSRSCGQCHVCRSRRQRVLCLGARLRPLGHGPSGYVRRPRESSWRDGMGQASGCRRRFGSVKRKTAALVRRGSARDESVCQVSIRL